MRSRGASRKRRSLSESASANSRCRECCYASDRHEPSSAKRGPYAAAASVERSQGAALGRLPSLGEPALLQVRPRYGERHAREAKRDDSTGEAPHAARACEAGRLKPGLHAAALAYASFAHVRGVRARVQSVSDG